MQISKENENSHPEAPVSVCPAGEVFPLPQEKDYQYPRRV